jgi:hypothetical protein
VQQVVARLKAETPLVITTRDGKQQIHFTPSGVQMSQSK